MRIELDRNDIKRLINAGEICKDGVTITLLDNQQAVAAAPQARSAVIVEMPVGPHVRHEDPARELEMRKDDALQKVEALLLQYRPNKDLPGS